MSFKHWFTQEYDRDLEQRIKRGVQISMSDGERAKTRDFLISYMRMHPARARVARTQSWTWWSVHPYPIIAGLLIVALGGSSVGAASLAEQSLPGDILYPIKVNVTEEVRAALATTPEMKADVALARAERRIEELNTLAARGELSEEIKNVIDDRIDEHVHDAEIETVLAENGGRERRLVAMLRVHENLIAESEVGGGEHDVTFAAVVAADAGMPAPEVMQEPEVATMAAMPAEDTAMTMHAAPAPDVSRASFTQESVAVPLEEIVAAKRADVPEINVKSIKRQMKAAEQRIESLKKLLDGKGKRVEQSALAHAQNELLAAQTAFSEGATFAKNESWGDAAVRFNAAVRIAIDAREFLADAPRLKDEIKDSASSGRDRNSDSRRDGERDAKNHDD